MTNISTASRTEFLMIQFSQTNEPGRTIAGVAEVIPFPPTGEGKGGEGGKGGAATAPLPPFPPSPPPAPKNASAGGRPASDSDEIYTPAPRQNPVLRALKEEGLYLSEMTSKQHAVTCPWAPEHGNAVADPAVYVEPTTLFPVGKFSCAQHGLNAPGIDRLLDRLGVDTADARCKPRIRLAPGEMLRILDAAERSLVSLNRFYQSGGAIVTVRGTANGDAAVSLVTDNVLTKALARAAEWEKFDGRSRDWKRCDPAPQLVRQLLNAQTFDHLPTLDGVARQPYFRSDRTLVTEPGYDPQTRVYAVFDRDSFNLEPPTEKAAQTALTELKGLLEEFHFTSEADRSAALGAMLTAAIRSSLPVAPAFNISASTPGSGKSYLGALITPFAGPGDPLNMSYPTTAEEASKSMLAALIGKPAVISFDDMQTNWLPFGMINRMLTSESVADRVLGVSRTITVATNVFVMGTGNNVVPVRDMSRRVVTIELRPPTGSPATLSYAGRPVERIKAQRGKFVAFALTIIQAWLAAGRPRTNVPDIASYGAWSEMVRQPLLWLGEADPANSLIEQVRSDPDAELLARFMAAWHQSFGSTPVTLRKVVDHAERANSAFLDTLMELPFAERGNVNRSKLGWYLRKNANRIVDGLHLQREDNSERTAWSVQSSRAQMTPSQTEAGPPDPTRPVMIGGEIF